MVLLPAAVALFFAALALEDAGVVAAAPYLIAAGLSALYFVRPMLGLWVVPFSGFAAFTVIILVAPLFGWGSGPLSDWLIFAALGAVPTILLWLARPRGEA